MHGAPAILLANTLGLALGGSAGPEAAIAAFGGAFATAIYSLPYIRNRNLISPSDHRLFVLSCMSIGISSILPSPIIAVSLISELFALSHGLGSVYLKYVVSSGIGGCVAYAVTNGIGTVSSSRFSEDWNESLATPSGIFADYLPLQSILLGIIGCVLGYVFLGAQLLLKQLSKKLVVNLNALSKFKLGTILTPAIGGIFVGVIAWILPGTTGVGEAGMVFLSQQPSAEGDAALFVATGLLKLLSLSICLSFGWTGGMIYPLLFIGSSVGAGISEATGWNRLLCMSCVAASLMSSHMPAPYAFWATTTSVYRAGLGSSYGTLISILVALLFGVALGTKQRLIIKLTKNNELKRSTVYLNLAVDD
ncbi:hypothetical protein TL16_g03759 [Triparma laevis f. inornata]|uniref:Chloride channel protein n=2 Tax=Triparma laevis TaxID=1534972 RepID=A0A9W7FA04_9STRA|nr:hypothetical protein TL16_g03759 [Triparma laevis f. inornata]GMI08261.1 hypothetical protein TrLO_g6460 [Triparma laevis f. longispina]